MEKFSKLLFFTTLYIFLGILFIGIIFLLIWGGGKGDNGNPSEVVSTSSRTSTGTVGEGFTSVNTQGGENLQSDNQNSGERDSPNNPANPIPAPTPYSATSLEERQKLLLEGARSRLGDKYDASYYSDGYPPQGKSACVDIIYFAYKKNDIDLMKEVNEDLESHPALYPAKGDYAINHRRCPNLIVWFQGFSKSLPKNTDGENLSTWEPGDVVFWSLENDGVADHCGIISDKKNHQGIPLVIHQFPPSCKEEDVLNKWTIMGHFRK